MARTIIVAFLIERQDHCNNKALIENIARKRWEIQKVR